MDTFEPIIGDSPDLDEPRLPLLTEAEALAAIGFLRRLSTLDTTHHGYNAAQLAGDLAGRVPTQ
ncbi:hypothetical protein [Streptomyces sp. NPDC013457]|uniref:hypothetical protein n=1 Tax=Streptomyces sp. NPDC013457 TaxID=3364866 RepID=UPI0036FB936D